MDFTQILSNLSSHFKNTKLITKESHPFTVMLISPHPDDECLTSSLALRLLKEHNAHIVNIAVTLGSEKTKQSNREKELKASTKTLGIENLILSENWKTKEKELKKILNEYRPELIFAPHSKDVHPTHIKSSELLTKVIKSTKLAPTLIAWTEYWGQNLKNNLLVEVPQEIINLQMQALLNHKGEIERNLYHLRLPGLMIDNVRRSELIIGPQSEMPLFAFGALYQLQIFKEGMIKNMKMPLSILKNQDDIIQIFKLILAAAAGSKTKRK